MGTYYNLENFTGEVTLNELFEMRGYVFDAIDKLQKDKNEKPCIGASIEGDGFNIVFKLNGKSFSLRCEKDN